MAKKLNIPLNFEEDNTLLGISWHKRDFQLVFHLNKEMKMNFMRVDDFFYCHGPATEGATFPLYYYREDNTKLTWFLISNIIPQTSLVPALSSTDFFILINGRITPAETAAVIAKIKTIQGVLTAYKLDLSRIKNIELILTGLELHMISALKKLNR
jgi:hypothetical protein